MSGFRINVVTIFPEYLAPLRQSLLGKVAAVRHEGADLLVVRRVDGGEALIPFVAAIVPSVDLDGGFLVIDPPEGLLEL